MLDLPGSPGFMRVSRFLELHRKMQKCIKNAEISNLYDTKYDTAFQASAAFLVNVVVREDAAPPGAAGHFHCFCHKKYSFHGYRKFSPEGVY